MAYKALRKRLNEKSKVNSSHFRVNSSLKNAAQFGNLHLCGNGHTENFTETGDYSELYRHPFQSVGPAFQASAPITGTGTLYGQPAPIP